MKKIITFLAIAIASITAQAQTEVYRFNNSLIGDNAAPTLTEVLSCGATSGIFGTSSINTTTGFCGSGAQTVFNFTAGGGLSYPNTQITGTYTINMLFSFARVTSYNRLIDFQNGQIDFGLYVLNGQLYYYPYAYYGAANSFVPNTFYLLTLVRDGASNQVEAYVDGTSVGTINDAANFLSTPTATTPVILFRDNIAGGVGCENSAGMVKYFTISPVTSTAAQVSQNYAIICSLPLPVKMLSFSVKKEGTNNLLQWETASEINTESFTIQHSDNAREWKNIGSVKTTGAGKYTFTDLQRMNSKNYYRLKIDDENGSTGFSNIVSQNNEEQAIRVLVAPNPAQDFINVTETNPSVRGTEATIYNMQGVGMTSISVRGTLKIDISNWPLGIYYLQVEGERPIKIVKQ